ncbi:hypothetical protein FA13DRAFT_1787940 [Coprinellus micaceus]|uniref:Uncharacterized protein n=1 Tax=Coprinellus micaceus TaxID=71717 RepID=A0A4Y7TMX7_COPMI|nr:hypothetical protein FA13DRAFT_1787940 [Coprinellus micaceus]
MSEVIDVESDDIFIESEWIGVGRSYPNSPPPHVIQARNLKLAIPEHEKALLLKGHKTVKELHAFALPPQSGELLFWAIGSWFSDHQPTVDTMEDVLKRPIPSNDHIARMERHFNQAWIGGAKSSQQSKLQSKTTVSGMDSIST